MILLDSLYINNSGGKVLLDILVKELYQSGADIFYLLDSRCKGSYPFLPEDKTLYVKASLLNRHSFYKNNRNLFSKVFCFANIPPSIRLSVPVYTYFHNLLLLEQPSDYPFKETISKKLKGTLISVLKGNSDKFIVQSENVKQIVCRKLNLKEDQCLIIPFYRELTCDVPYTRKKKEFVYISNGNSHKNHKTLFKAWEILKEKKELNIPLHLTVTPDYQLLTGQIKAYQAKGYKIENHQFVNVKDLYDNYRYCVYPSLTESFGLGLIESVDTQTEVIAADLPYVKAVIEPAGTFDPLSPESIAEAVINLYEKSEDSFISRKKAHNQIKDLISLLTA